jgi:hypothetical protein
MHDFRFVAFLVSEQEFEDTIHEKASWLGNAAINSLFVIKKCV